MARPKQDGLLYFPFDTDFFYADKRIKRFHSKFGNDGLIFYIYLLTEIYRNGYYISWDEDTADDIATDLRLKEGFIEQVMIYLRGRSLLAESTLSTGVTIITSPGIQKRYQEAVKSRKRDVYVDSEIWILSEEETAAHIKVTVNESKSCGNDNKSCGNESKSCGNDIKESKVNKSKVNKKNARTNTDIERFEFFWCCYPLDKNRYLAEQAYIGVIMDGIYTEDNLVEAAKNYAEYCKITGTDKIYHADNFLEKYVFEGYLPGKYKKPNRKKHNISFNDFPQREYDFEELEKRLLSNNLE